MLTVAEYICEGCGKKFIRRPQKTIRFCSLSCSGKSNNRKRIDLTGKKIGRLTVISEGKVKKLAADRVSIFGYACAIAEGKYGNGQRFGISLVPVMLRKSAV